MKKSSGIFEAVLHGISCSMKYSGAFCLMGMVCVTTADIIGRNLGHPVFGSEEITALFAALAVAFSIPHAHRKDAHVGVEVAVKRLPARAQVRLKSGVCFVSLVLFSLLAWRMFLYGGSMMRSGELSMNLALPEYLVIFQLALCFAVFSLQLAVGFLRSFKGC